MSVSDYLNKFFDFLKGIYYYYEDRWYNVLDKIETKIPIYKIIDPVDRVVPSFVLFLLLLLFFIVFLLYLIKFTSPYDITFLVSDSETKSSLSGVIIGGTINDEVFNERTDSNGKAFVTSTSVKKNFFDIVGSIFFGDAPLFFGVISATKEGYKPISKKELELSNKENKILLQRLPSEPDYPGAYTIRLVDLETNDLIIDDSGLAYVKFKCDNKNIAGGTKKITDISDALIDGLFSLVENNCAFVVTEAYAPGYEPQGTAITLPLNKSEYDVKLRKLSDPNEGTAKVGVYSSGTDGNTMLSGIRVEFHKGSINEFAISNNGGWAEKTDLEAGKYFITISDANYYPITADSNISIDVIKDQTTILMIRLIEIRPEDRRIVFFKVVDSVDNNALANVTVELFDLVIDSNGNYSGITQNNSSYYYSGPPFATDGNGLYKRVGLSVLSGNVFAVIKKDGYIYKMFKPALKLTTDSPEIISLEKANASNSGSATITVKSTSAKLLPSAKTFLYFNGAINGLNLTNIKINSTQVLTNSLGVASFTELPLGIYSASAEFDSSFSGITPTKVLDANQKINFDININLNVSFLKLELINAQTTSRINSGDVNIYFIGVNGLTFSEKISTPTSGFFISRPYPRASTLAATAKAINFVPNTIYFTGLTPGENFGRILLYAQGVCRADSYCNSSCDVDPDCTTACNPATFDGVCPDECTAGNDRDCALCIADGTCTTLCGARDPDCDCSANGICNEIQCGDSDPDCRENEPFCGADHTCNPLCENDPDCNTICNSTSRDNICAQECTPQNDLDCGDCILNDGICKEFCGSLDPDCDCSANGICNETQCGASDPDCTVNSANIRVNFDDIYSQNDNYYNRSTVNSLNPNTEYKIKFDIVVNTLTTYDELLGMIRVNGPVEFTNSLPNGFDLYRKEQSIFDCNNSILDLAQGVRDNNYYLPSSCHNILNKFIHAGYRWGDSNIPRGTYSYIASFKVNSGAQDNEKILFQYRAKENNSVTPAETSETILKIAEFYVNRPFRSGFYFTVKLNNKTSTILPGATGNYENVTIYPTENNFLSVQAYNNSSQTLSNGKIKVYSYFGNPSTTTSATNFSSSKGNIFFNSSLTESEKLLTEGLSINAHQRSSFFDTNIYAQRFNSTNWIVIVAEFDSNKYIGFIDAKSVGKTLTLSAEFLAGVPNQLFDGEVRDRYSSENPIISEVKIEVAKNCRTTPVPVRTYNLWAPSNNINENYFAQQIEGTYAYMQDCVYVSVKANNPTNDYAPISRQRILASSGSSVDPSLACIDITMKGENRGSNTYLEEEMRMYWNGVERFEIKNNCAKQVIVAIDVGLVCKDEEQNNCSNESVIAIGETKEYTLTGRNIDYIASSPKPNFTDVLGYYPLIVKAKFAEQSKKKFSISARAHLHLSNPNQCFSISEDYFDFMENNSSKMDFVLTNECQYTLIGDYFIPKVILNSFGYDLNTNNPKVSTISFKPQATITGNNFDTIYENVNIKTQGSTELITPQIEKSYILSGERFRHYHSLSFDLSQAPGIIDELQVRFFDINNAKLEPNDPYRVAYGAAIEGQVVITYKDGNVVRKTPSFNFDLNEEPKCVTQGVPTGNEHCETGSELNDFIYGLFYINLTPKAGIQKVDFNIIGNPDRNYLELTLRPQLNLIERRPKTILSNDSTTTTIDLMDVATIPAIEGIVYIIKNINDINGLSQKNINSNNPLIFISSNNPQVVTWIEGDSLKATFVGNDYAPFNDGTIEASLVKTFGQSITYGTVDIIDYVSTSTAGGKQISGVQ